MFNFDALMWLLFSFLYSLYSLDKQNPLDIALVAIQALALLVVGFMLWKTGLPPATPKSDFSLPKKISFLVLQKKRADIIVFPLALVIFQYVVPQKMPFLWLMLFCFAALWLFRIMNFERYLNEK